ncbi:MAG TPA: PilZ domain-containing protein [Terriglobia bacterium]|nr:PilZ domain-containing protein [Terriglobia bacterium]
MTSNHPGVMATMTSQTNEKRRSDRLWLTVPVRVEGADSAGEKFECEGRVINLNRHGARIQVSRELTQSQPIRLKSPDAEHQADFRVVEIISAAGSPDVEYGAECLSETQNFWQIEFPPPEYSESEVSRVLLECNKCNTMALLPLTLSEVQAVRSMGWVGKSCPVCAGISLWKYAQVGKTQSEHHSKDSHRRPSSWVSGALESNARNHRRVYVIMPLGVRDAEGNEEITRTENISKCGFCFASDKIYRLGESITVTFENAPDSLAHTTVLPAQIIREQSILGAQRKLYGATYC